MARVRISDVAAAAGVSTATVSLVLNDRTARISDATADRVRQAAARGRVHPQLRRPGTADAAQPHDRPDLRPDRDDPLRRPHARRRAGRRPRARLPRLPRRHRTRTPTVEREAIRALADQQVDATDLRLHVAPGGRRPGGALPRHRVPRLPPRRRRLPGGRPRRPRRRGRGRARARRTRDTVGSPTSTSTSRTLPSPPTCAIEGYLEVLAEAGIDPDPALHVRGDDLGRRAGGRPRTGSSTCPSDRRPTALFCFNDRMAAGVVRRRAPPRARASPRTSRSSATTTSSSSPAELDPPLTTVALPHYEMGRWAMEVALGIRAGRPRRPTPHAVPDRPTGLVGPPPATARQRQPATGLTRPQRPPSAAAER